MLLGKIAAASAIALLALPAAAQNAGSGSVPTVTTPAEAKALIGAPLETNPPASEYTEETGDVGPLFVIDGNNVKPQGEWTAADRKACDDAGGVELPISAGRVACFRL